MKAALLAERGVIKVVGDDVRKFLNGLLTTDIGKVSPQSATFAALLTPQGKIMVDMIVVEAPAEDGGGFFLDCPRALSPTFTDRLDFYKLRAKLTVENLSEALGVMAAWEGREGKRREVMGDGRVRTRIAVLPRRVGLVPFTVQTGRVGTLVGGAELVLPHDEAAAPADLAPARNV